MIETFTDLCDNLHLAWDHEWHRVLRDGTYMVADTTEVLSNDNVNPELHQIQRFMMQHPEWVFARAYETCCWMLLSSRPERIDPNIIGTGFNYGVTALIEDCPKRLLILAEND